MRQRIHWIDFDIPTLFRILSADQGLGQASGMAGIIHPKPPLDAQALFIGWPILAAYFNDFIVFNMDFRLTADATEGADRVYNRVRCTDIDLTFIDLSGGHQRPGRAGLNTFTTGDTGRLAHRIIKIKHDLGPVPAIGHADHIIDLNFPTGANTQIAMDTGIKIDPHCRMTGIRFRRRALRKTGCFDIHFVDPCPELAVCFMGDFPRGLVSQ